MRTARARANHGATEPPLMPVRVAECGVLDETLESLRATALAASDAGGYFPALYSRVTRRVMADAAAGRFADGERMGAFVRGFAARYLDARNGPVPAPACWQASFAMTGDASLLVVQHLFLGINAHVNFDLPQTVVNPADMRGDLASIRPDFDGRHQPRISVSIERDFS